MEPDDIEYIAENEMVSIIPNFNSPQLTLVAGDFGPFRAGLPLRVPLWLAVSLKQQQRCKVHPPDWMNVETLEEIKRNEQSSETFTKMPNEHYMIEAKLLLGHAFDDIPRSDEVKTIIKDLWDIRMSKLRSSIDILVKGNDTFAAVDNLTMLEINSVRPILPSALDHLNRMKKKATSTRSQLQSTTLGTSFLSRS